MSTRADRAPSVVYVLFRARREATKRPAQWAWQRIYQCLTFAQMERHLAEYTCTDGDRAYVVFSLSPHGHMEVAHQDAVRDKDVDAYAMRSIVHQMSTLDLWSMWSACAVLADVSSLDDCQPDHHWHEDRCCNPHDMCQDAACGGRCGKQFSAKVTT